MANYSPEAQAFVKKFQDVQAEQAELMKGITGRPRPEGTLPVMSGEERTLMDKLQGKIDLLSELIEMHNLDKK